MGAIFGVLARDRAAAESTRIAALEHALARRLIQVVDSSGQALPGKWTLGHEERSGRFEPERGWPRGVAKLRLSGVIEDLAGNNPGKAFDVDVFERARAPSGE